jgi:dihydroflavonol-4-reductase
MVQTRTVLVTGATGFLGSRLVADLLAAGYTVRGTVRSLDRSESYAHLLALPGADRLTLVEADLLDAASFTAAVAGITDVMHTASPYVLDVADPQRDLVDPAVDGTLNVLSAAAREPSVRRVVLTSSFAAVTDEPDGTRVLTEADWNEKSTLSRNPYYYSKTLAERAAWDFMAVEPRGLDLVVINPFLIIGPALGPVVNTSNQVFVDLTTGTYPGILSLSFGMVDVRDVSAAHIKAMETPTASGRYLCAGDVVTMRDLVATMRDVLPASVTLPTRSLDNAFGTQVVKLASRFQPSGVGSYLRSHLGRTPRYDTARIRRDLGMEFRPAEESIRDAVFDLVQHGHIAIAEGRAAS